MSGSELDDLVEDQDSLIKAAADHFDPETEVQEEDTDPETEEAE